MLIVSLLVPFFRDVDGRVGYHSTNRLQLFSRHLHVGLRQEHDKLFPSVARHHVAPAKYAAERVGHCAESHVASRVPVRVVEELEVIHVNHGEGERVRVTTGAAHFRRHALVKIRTVEKSCQAVAHGKLPQTPRAQDTAALSIVAIRRRIILEICAPN